jgi:hypothetical protein
MGKETVDSKIRQEETTDLVNIHSFLFSITLGNENMTAFELLLLMHTELKRRPEAKEYLKKITELIN